MDKNISKPRGNGIEDVFLLTLIASIISVFFFYVGRSSLAMYDYQVDVSDSGDYVYNGKRLIGIIRNDTSSPYQFIFTEDNGDGIQKPIIIEY